MENVALLAQEEITQSTAPLGKIRVGVTEGLGIMFLASRMIGLFERYPGLEVELVAVPRFVSILNREAEISIHLERPAADMLVTRKLTDYRLALYASQAYLDRHRRCRVAKTWPGMRGSATSTICCSARN
jgi:DNA-binding transcriptional LysR family regulator